MFWIIFACVVALFVIVIARSDPLPVCGIYRQPGKWYYVKYWIFYMLVTRRKRSTKNRPEVLTGKDAGYGTKSRSSEKEMDCVQNLSLEHPLVRYRHNIVTFLRLFTVNGPGRAFHFTVNNVVCICISNSTQLNRELRTQVSDTSKSAS